MSIYPIREADDDHFYGGWSGGGRAKGGHPAGGTTEAEHSEGGVWSAERAAAVHDPYLDSLTDGVPVSDSPTVYMTGGGPASGKSTAIMNNPEAGIPGKGKAVHVDPDSAKSAIPEYAAGTMHGNRDSASYVHEESSYMAKAGVARSLGMSRDVVYDSVGDSGIDKLSAKVGQMRAQGARTIVADYATVNIGTAIARSDARAAKTGRWVPHAYITHAHRDVSQTFHAAAQRGLFDRMRLWDNNGASARLVAEYDRGRGLRILDDKAYSRFRAQGMSEGP